MQKSVAQVVEHYPDNIQELFNQLRDLIYVLAEKNNLGEIEETLKWGEPAYLVQTAVQ